MGIFQFPENKAADGLGFQTENQGKFRVQELLGIVQEILVGLMELPTGFQLGLFMTMERTDHAHQLRPVPEPINSRNRSFR